MEFEPLILNEPPGSLWTDFQAGARLPALEPGMPVVIDRWKRSRKLGADYQGPRPEDALARGSSLAERVDCLGPLLQAGSDVIERFASAASQHNYSLLVASPDGVIVTAVGGGQFADFARQVRLMPGADWSEAMRGTNAIGTAAAEQRPVFVRGGAHFARSYHELVCYAAPIRDASGQLVAVLDATSFRDRDDPSMGLGVVAAAQTLEELLRVQAYSLAGATVTRALARSLERMNCPVAVIEPPGRIARLNPPAREVFGAASVDRGCDRLFGRSWSELAELGQSGSADTVCVAGCEYSLRIEPIESDGRLIALLTFFEPRRSRAPSLSSSRPPETTPERRRPARPSPFKGFFAEDPAARRALERATLVANSRLPVMLLAETGVGKELVARGVHRASPRAARPFVALNCGAINPTLLESELFGYGPGAFTGAARAGHEGYAKAADGGTLFLDEVAEMPLAMQAALLRFLEDGTYRRVGETRERRADVRVVCATCRDLESLVGAEAFRTDLYYRLKGASIALPPLRERTDLLPLAHHLVRELAVEHGLVPAPALSSAVESLLAGLPWPGNVRQLRSTLDVALVLANGAVTIEPEHLPDDLRGKCPGSAPGDRSLDTVQSRAIQAVLAEAAGNVSLAARRLGIARSTLYRRMRRYGLADAD